MTIPKHSFMHGGKASSYIMFNTSQDLNSAYLKYLKDAEKLMLDAAVGLSAIIYTELADVEHEVMPPHILPAVPHSSDSKHSGWLFIISVRLLSSVRTSYCTEFAQNLQNVAHL